MFELRSAAGVTLSLTLTFDGQRLTTAVSLSYNIEFVWRDGAEQLGEA
jgi:hypothetical protein